MGKNKLTAIIAISLAFIITAGIAGIFGYKTAKKNKTISQADSLVAIEKYQDGIGLYENLLSESYDKDVAARREKAVELMESKANYEKAMEFLDAQDHKGAIRYFLKVSPNDKKRYGETAQNMSEIEETLLEQIRYDFDYGNEDGAIQSLDEYLKTVPTSVAAKNLKDDLKFTQEEAKAKAKREQEEAEKKAAEEAAALETEWEAYNIVDTYQTIVAKNANLRIAPKLDADVVMTIPQGAEVYIYDTKVENSERFWCQIRYYDEYGDLCNGWISYNTMNYKY